MKKTVLSESGCNYPSVIILSLIVSFVVFVFFCYFWGLNKTKKTTIFQNLICLIRGISCIKGEALLVIGE